MGSSCKFLTLLNSPLPGWRHIEAPLHRILWIKQVETHKTHSSQSFSAISMSTCGDIYFIYAKRIYPYFFFQSTTISTAIACNFNYFNWFKEFKILVFFIVFGFLLLFYLKTLFYYLILYNIRSSSIWPFVEISSSIL